MPIERILVRVKPGHRLREAGCSYVEGQTFYVDDDRLSSLADSVVVVQGVAPIVKNAAVLQAPRQLEPEAIPLPDARRIEEPEPVVTQEQDVSSKEEEEEGEAISEVEEAPKKKKKKKKGLRARIV